MPHVPTILTHVKVCNKEESLRRGLGFMALDDLFANLENA